MQMLRCLFFVHVAITLRVIFIVKAKQRVVETDTILGLKNDWQCVYHIHCWVCIQDVCLDKSFYKSTTALRRCLHDGFMSLGKWVHEFGLSFHAFRCFCRLIAIIANYILHTYMYCILIISIDMIWGKAQECFICDTCTHITTLRGEKNHVFLSFAFCFNINNTSHHQVEKSGAGTNIQNEQILL